MKKFKKVLKGYMIYSIIVTIVMICTSEEYRKELKRSFINGYRIGRNYFNPYSNIIKVPDIKINIEPPHIENWPKFKEV